MSFDLLINGKRLEDICWFGYEEKNSFLGDDIPLTPLKMYI